MDRVHSFNIPINHTIYTLFCNTIIQHRLHPLSASPKRLITPRSTVSRRRTAPAILTAAITKSRSRASHFARSSTGTISRHLKGSGRRGRGGFSGDCSRASSSAAGTKAGLAACTAVDGGRAAPSSAGAAVSKGATLAGTVDC